jgi:kynurenine formamidase
MQVIDLGAEIFDGQKSHFRVTVNDFASYEDTTVFCRPPARGFATRLIQMCDHTATHVDAPVHFFPGAATIDTLPVMAFCGTAVCVDLSEARAGEAAAEAAHFEEAAARAGISIREGDIVLIRLGEAGYRGLSAGLADTLAERRIMSVGVDLATPDCPEDKTMPVHMRLLGAVITIIEGLRNLDLVAGRRFLYVGTPLKIVGATGSPVRPVAILE